MAFNDLNIDISNRLYIIGTIVSFAKSVDQLTCNLEKWLILVDLLKFWQRHEEALWYANKFISNYNKAHNWIYAGMLCITQMSSTVRYNIHPIKHTCPNKCIHSYFFPEQRTSYIPKIKLNQDYQPHGNQQRYLQSFLVLFSLYFQLKNG